MDVALVKIQNVDIKIWIKMAGVMCMQHLS